MMAKTIFSFKFLAEFPYQRYNIVIVCLCEPRKFAIALHDKMTLLAPYTKLVTHRNDITASKQLYILSLSLS